jgi:hypothetical protein
MSALVRHKPCFCTSVNLLILLYGAATNSSFYNKTNFIHSFSIIIATVTIKSVGEYKFSNSYNTIFLPKVHIVFYFYFYFFIHFTY